jgi:hypothetical protein
MAHPRLLRVRLLHAALPWLPVQKLAPFMVVSITCEEPKPIYECVWTVEVHGGYIFNQYVWQRDLWIDSPSLL